MIDTALVPYNALIFGFSLTVVVGLSAALTGWVMSRLAGLFNP